MTGRSLLIVGSGGHAKVALDCARRMGSFECITLCTNQESEIGSLHSHEVIRQEDALSSVRCWDCGFVAIGDSSVREKLTNRFLEAGLSMATLIHPAASVSDFSLVQEGTIVCAGANVGPDAMVGRGVIINTGADVEHDCRVGDWSHLSPGSVICGGTSIGSGAWLCACSCVADHLCVSDRTVLAAGSTLVQSADTPGLYAGSPARLIKKIV